MKHSLIKNIFIPFIILVFLTAGSTNFSFAQTCIPSGNPAIYGTNNTWIGYMYRGINFNNYMGSINAGNAGSPNFNQTFNGAQVNYPTSGCAVYTDTFSVRFRLRKTFTNEGFEITVGGDDGYRFSVDGGNTWIINRWSDQGYNTTTTAVLLNGTVDLVLEYYERFGDNRVSFSMVSTCIGSSDQNVYGTGGTWNGYLYQGTNFNIFKGRITRGDVLGNFNETFGSSNGTFNTDGCPITTQQFSARFRSSRNFPAGTYVITVGGDDGYRLSLDGGNSWVINRWNDQSYTVTSYTASLSGTVNMVLEYYENGGDNRISFNISGGTLPVTLKSFKGILVPNKSVELSWIVSDAVNFSRFRIEKSKDALNYFPLYEETYINNKTSYSFFDKSPVQGNNYYRIAMIDVDGSLKYSSVIIVSNNGGVNTLKVYPTIINDRKVFISGVNLSKGAMVEFVSMTGHVLFNQKINTNSSIVEISLPGHIKSGMCVIRITNQNTLLHTEKMIIK